jgi:cell division protein FtsB
MVHSSKRLLFRIFFVLEIVLFLWSYTFGSHGLYAIWQIRSECKHVLERIEVLHQKIAEMKACSKALEEDPFFKEKIAREQLQMARADEIIYYY